MLLSPLRKQRKQHKHNCIGAYGVILCLRLKAALQSRVFHTCVYTHGKVEISLNVTYEITE
jgi:hypothetical protein